MFYAHEFERGTKDQLISMYGVIPRIEIGPIRAISITYLTLTYFCNHDKLCQLLFIPKTKKREGFKSTRL